MPEIKQWINKMNENVETGREKRMIVNGLDHDIFVEAKKKQLWMVVLSFLPEMLIRLVVNWFCQYRIIFIDFCLMFYNKLYGRFFVCLELDRAMRSS